jgi:hypothetical protein
MVVNCIAEIRKLRDEANLIARQNPHHPKLRLIHAHSRELETQAAQGFAALNGWHLTDREFATGTLARGGPHVSREEQFNIGISSHELFDHCVYFRELERPYRAAAIVTQPYNTDLDQARELAAEIGLALHAPPKPTASWWYPGWARFFCLTRPGHAAVRFLPEQQGELK